jgi:nucleotide-binding universal stress UspA family protein
MFKKILAPLDMSALAESVLPHVITVAKTFQSSILLLVVSETIGSSSRSLSVDPLEWQIKRVEDDAYIQRIRTELRNAGLEAEAQLMEGDPAENIVELCRNSDVDLVIISSHGRSGLTGWNVSSVVHKVIQRVHTSVMIVRAYRPTPSEMEPVRYQRLLVPLDGSQRAESIIPIAISLTETNRAELHLVCMVEKPEMPSRTPLKPSDLELIGQIVERNREEAQNYFDHLQDRIAIEAKFTILVNDNVADALHSFVEEQNVDLILLSAHGYGYTGQTLRPYGRLAMSLIEYGTSPLLVLQDISKGEFLMSKAEHIARDQGGR